MRQRSPRQLDLGAVDRRNGHTARDPNQKPSVYGVDQVFTTFALLREGADPAEVEKKLAAVVERHYAPEDAARTRYELYPHSRIYLHLTSDYVAGYVYEASASHSLP